MNLLTLLHSCSNLYKIKKRLVRIHSHGGECEGDLSSGTLRRVLSQKLANVSEMLTASIIRAMGLHDATSRKTFILKKSFR
jgi:hypothetical protein